MQQIDLEPEAYRVTGRQKLVRSVLHKPVFMTISTILGIWVAAAIGVPRVSNGVFEVPAWLMYCLWPSLVVTPAFFIWAVLNDQDRVGGS